MNTGTVPKLIDKLNYLLDLGEWIKLDKNNYTDSNVIKNAVLIVKDKNEMIRLKNQFISYKFDFTGQLNKLTAIKENAIRLLAVLQKEYHLK